MKRDRRTAEVYALDLQFSRIPVRLRSWAKRALETVLLLSGDIRRYEHTETKNGNQTITLPHSPLDIDAQLEVAILLDAKLCVRMLYECTKDDKYLAKTIGCSMAMFTKIPSTASLAKRPREKSRGVVLNRPPTPLR